MINTTLGDIEIKNLEAIKLNYDLITHKDIHPSITKKEYLGNKYNRVCRFCRQDKSQTTFKKIAHAIPELLGNKSLVSYYECDQCNEKFSTTLENHLSGYLSYYRSLARIKGKRGNVKFKQHDIKIHSQSNKVHIETTKGNEKLSIDKKNNKLIIKINRDPYIPIAVYKCFAKIALSIIDENEIQNVDWAIKWIGEDDHTNSQFKFSKLIMWQAFTSGNFPNTEIMIRILRRKPRFEYKIPFLYKVQYMLCIVRFENLTFQISIPSKEDFNKGTINIREFSYPVLERKHKQSKTKYFYKDMSNREIVKDDDFLMKLKFESAEDITQSFDSESKK